MADGARPRIPWQAWFVLLAAIWGCSFWWIKLGLTFLSPVQVAFVRTALGAAALLVILVATRRRLPRDRRTCGHLLVVVLVAFREEQVTRERIAGLAIGFVGVLVVIGAWEGLGAGDVPGIGACIVAICCYGIAFPYIRRYLSDLPGGPIAMATGQLAIGAIVLFPLAALASGPGTVPTPDALLGTVCLGVLGSGVAFAINYRIVAVAGSTTASTVTYLTPLVAVVVGTVFLSEPITWHEPVGALVVLLGVAISQERIRFPSPGTATERAAG